MLGVGGIGLLSERLFDHWVLIAVSVGRRKKKRKDEAGENLDRCGGVSLGII